MKEKFKAILKGVFLTSIASLTPIDDRASSNEIKFPDFDNQFGTKLRESNPLANLKKKLLLKFNNDNSTYALIGHRSHRSHSSHRSHYSHYSSSTGTTNSLSPRSSGSSTNYPPAKDTDGYTRPKQNSSKTIVYKLGDRVLKKGMKGHDVTELLNILVVKRYIVPKEGTPVIATGEYEFTSLIENAVKDFQKGNNLEVDGIVGVTTIYYLKKQND